MQRDEKQLADGDVKVWRQDFKEIIIHHQAGLTISLIDLEEIELFQWLQTDLSKRGLLPDERETLKEHLRQAYVLIEKLNEELFFKR